MNLPIKIEDFSGYRDNIHRKSVMRYKRVLDIACSLLILLFALPIVFPLIIFLLFSNQGSPVFFTQQRVGYKGKKFLCYKFRTMHSTIQSDGTEQIVINRIGRVLRNTGLDELPQLLNVLKGDMSIVGPRPYSLQDDQYFEQIVPYYHLRNTVLPGITGLAQTNGYKGWIKTDEEIMERTTIDLMYVEQMSCWVDLRIILRSVLLLLIEMFRAIWKR